VGDRNLGALVPAMGLETMDLVTEVSALGPGCCVGGFDQGGLPIKAGARGELSIMIDLALAQIPTGGTRPIYLMVLVVQPAPAWFRR